MSAFFFTLGAKFPLGKGVHGFVPVNKKTSVTRILMQSCFFAIGGFFCGFLR